MSAWTRLFFTAVGAAVAAGVVYFLKKREDDAYDLDEFDEDFEEDEEEAEAPVEEAAEEAALWRSPPQRHRQKNPLRKQWRRKSSRKRKQQCPARRARSWIWTATASPMQ